ncbi:MAG TPA: NADH-quinone oxidoreductase subunit L [Candidatus Acidoferrales bacterium]|nr:NADH-quinone oxidoreductase subunit L [Candidatus Acidoferrales bacterium]
MSSQALAFLVLALPAAGALLLAGRGWRWPRLLTQLVGPGVVWLSFASVVWLFVTDQHGEFTYWTWARSGDFDVPFNLLVDHLSLFMGLVITGVGGLIITYAVGYMEHETDPSYARFFCYMDVFVLSMLLLVFAGNFVFLIVGWAGVGVSSYFLIGFYYWRPSAVVAARKAFVMNVIGDVGMILGTFVLFVNYHAATYTAVFHALPKNDNQSLELAAFLFLAGAVAKSAQLPLHTWLPDAMEGPTPVSALIHAATMVTAGVYLVGRLAPIYNLAQYAHDAVALVGAATALFAASIALVQVDIKRVLAYSTMSQIGYMFLAVGVGAYAAGFFHLLAHAFFKALLFMAAGNVIHALHDEQDMRRFGGLWNQMRATSVFMLVGALSLAGIIPFVGFWSKELVLGDAFSKFEPVAMVCWSIGFVTALLTGFYTGRMWWLAFTGRPSPERPVEHPHEAPPVMLVPVAILAVLSTIGGVVQVNAGFHPGWKLVEDYLASVVGPLPWEPRDLEYLPTAATVLLAGFTFFLAASFYGARARYDPAAWRRRLAWLQTALERKYWFDEVYDQLFVRPLDWTAAASERYVDRPLIDGAVIGVAHTTEGAAGGLSLTQSGYLRNYVLVIVGGALVAAAVILWRAYG